MNQGIVIWILSILFLGSAVFGGYTYYKNLNLSKEKGGNLGGNENQAGDEGCYGLKSFTGTQVKISFDYPEIWGNAEEKVVAAADSPDDVTQAGKNYKITFSKNPYLTISGASPDFEAAGIGGACPIRNFVNGEGQDYQCASQEEASGEVVQCDTSTIDGQNAVSFFYVPGNECSIGSVAKVIYSPIPDQQFPAFALEMRLSWISDLQVADMGSRIGSGEATGDQATFLQNKIDTLVDDEKTELSSGSYTNYLADLQIAQIDALVSSIQFSN